MANAEHTKTVGRGRYIWNQWRLDHPTEKPDLRAAYFREADLQEYNLSGADLRASMMLGASLRGADLRGADLSFADLRFVDFTGAQLEGARFQEAKGIDDSVLKATKGPSRMRRHLVKLAGVAALAALLYSLVAMGVISVDLESWKESAGETAGSWFGGDGEAEASEVDEPSGADAELEARLAAIEKRLLEIQFSTWRIEQVYMSQDSMHVRTDQETLSEEAYMPTLAATCGVLAGREDGWRPDEIQVLDQSETGGWVFRSPEKCADLIRTPPGVMRVAIAADTRALSADE